MDPLLNPFRPGAGARPPELAGRQGEIDALDLIVAKSRRDQNDGGLVLYGLRGVGKTVLLNRLRHDVERADWLTVQLEARPGEVGAQASRQSLARGLSMAARGMSRFRHAAASVLDAISTVATFSFTVAGVSMNLGAPPSEHRANSGVLEVDLEEMVADLAEPLRKNRSALAIFVDEMQDLDEELLTALLSVQHRATQADWPFYLIGAGLPTLKRIMAESRSYTERFTMRQIGPLEREDAIAAVLKPAMDLGVEFTPDALDAIVDEAQGYPFFLQSYGKAVWDLASSARIDLETAQAGIAEGNADLDQSFFPARWDRTTRAEKQYLRALAEVGPASASTSAIAAHLGVATTSLSSVRHALIDKGIIYAESRGTVGFTVPNMETFILRSTGAEE